MSEAELHTIKSLLSAKISFKRLHDKHQYLDERVAEAQKGVFAIDSMSLEKMKKEKLLLKDRIERVISEFNRNQAAA